MFSTSAIPELVMIIMMCWLHNDIVMSRDKLVIYVSQPVICYFCRMSIYKLPWSILSTHLTGVITVTEEEIIAAMKLVSEIWKWERYSQLPCLQIM